MARSPIADELQEVLPGCYTWQAFCSQAKVELTSHALVMAGSIYLIDPIRLSAAGLAELENLGGKPCAVLLTNGNHERDAAFYQSRYQIPVHARSEAASEMEIATTPFPDRLTGLEIIPLPGAGLGEIGIYLNVRKLLCLGDIIINLDSFAFALLPDKYATDPQQMKLSLQRVLDKPIATICFAHGLPVVGNAQQRLAALVL